MSIIASNAIDGRARVTRVGLGLAIVATMLGRTGTAWAELGSPVHLGDAVPANPADPAQELTEGKSSTVFTLRLPTRASCPGDSANDSWRFQGFIIPAGDDPGSLVYNDVGPTGKSQFALYEDNSNPLSDALIDMNDAPGQPGVLPPIPPLSFRVFPPGTLAPGRYTVGIACTWFKRQTSQWWDAEVIITEAPDDEPGQLTWRLASVPAPEAANESSSGLLLPLAGGAAIVVIAAVALAQRKRRALHAPHRSQESR